MTILFRSAEDGFLAIYLVDEKDDVFQLLPYRRDSRSCFPVKGGQDYVFFPLQAAGEVEKNQVDEYVLTAESETAYHYIYTVFSPERFPKADADVHGISSGPARVSLDAFRKWLSESRIRDVQMVVDRQEISLRRSWQGFGSENQIDE